MKIYFFKTKKLLDEKMKRLETQRENEYQSLLYLYDHLEKKSTEYLKKRLKYLEDKLSRYEEIKEGNNYQYLLA